MEYGIQMYSVRDLTKESLDEARRQVAELGYKFVEFAGFFGHTAEEVKGMLDKYGLKVSGTHTGWQEIAEHFEETVAFHKAIGNKNIIIPGADLGNQEKLDAFIKMANEFQPKLAAEGITLGYHNHDHEFKLRIGQKTVWEWLWREADGDDLRQVTATPRFSSSVLQELDCGNCVLGGGDPVAWIDRFPGRIPCVHLMPAIADAKGHETRRGRAWHRA